MKDTAILRQGEIAAQASGAGKLVLVPQQLQERTLCPCR
jgi:hypothetical protein